MFHDFVVSSNGRGTKAEPMLISEPVVCASKSTQGPYGANIKPTTPSLGQIQLGMEYLASRVNKAAINRWLRRELWLKKYEGESGKHMHKALVSGFACYGSCLCLADWLSYS